MLGSSVDDRGSKKPGFPKEQCCTVTYPFRYSHRRSVLAVRCSVTELSGFSKLSISVNRYFRFRSVVSWMQDTEVTESLCASYSLKGKL